jgi:hypothetical protein
MFEAIWTVLQPIVEAAWWLIEKTIVDPIVFIYENWNGIVDWFSDLFDDTIGVITDIWDGIVWVFKNPIEAIKLAWTAVIDWLGDLIDGAVDKISDVIDDAKGLPGAVEDLFTGDFGARVKGTAEEQQLAHVAHMFKRMGHLSEEDQQKQLQILDATNALKKGKAHDLARALEITNMDMAKAAALIQDEEAFKSAKAKDWAAQQAIIAATAAKEAEMKAATDVTGVITDEANKQVGVQLQAADDLKKGMDEKSEAMLVSVKARAQQMLDAFGINLDLDSAGDKVAAFMKKAKEHAESQALEAGKGIEGAMPGGEEKEGRAKSMILDRRGMGKVGKAAIKSFKDAGRAVDGFGDKFGKRMDSDVGKKNIAVVAEKTFKRLVKAATKLRDVLRNVWVDILDRMALAFKAINLDTTALLGQMRAMAAASKAVVSAKGASEGEEAPAVRAKWKQSETQRQTYEAIHRPDWYYDSYKEIATAQMNALAHISGSMGGASPQGGRGATESAAQGMRLKGKAFTRWQADQSKPDTDGQI